MEFTAGETVALESGDHVSAAYVVMKDFNIRAVNSEFRIYWRMSGRRVISHPPSPTGSDFIKWMKDAGYIRDEAT